MSVTKQELAQLQETINQFRVNELQLLLSAFRISKLGKKQELVDRALQLLNRKDHQAHVIEHVKNIQKSNMAQQRYNSQPYTYGSTAQMNNQNQGLRNLMGSTPNYDPRYAPNMYSNQNYAMQYQNMMNQNMFGFSGMHQQQLQHGMQPQSGLAKNLKISNLPFYHEEKTLLEIAELPAQISASRTIDSKRVFNFYIPRDDISKLVYRNEPVKLPRYEIQMRIFQLELDGEQPDAFPPGCQVYLDDTPVALPSIIPTNKPNAEQKRLSRPVNLTPYIQNPSARADRPYRINVQWQVDKRGWAIGVWLVNRLNTDILQTTKLADPKSRRALAVTKRNIIRRLAGDEDEVQMDSIKVSLIDPLVKTRIKIPARSSECEHLQCFDLTNFLMMNEKRPSWKCAICDKNAHYSKLIIDEYYEKLISDVPRGTDEVELLRDGTWRLVSEECEMLSDSDNEMSAASNSTPAKPQATPIAAQKKQEAKSEPEIVTLDSDSEDEPEKASFSPIRQPLSSNSAASTPSNQLPTSSLAPPHPSLNDSHSSDDSIIVLDDNDDQPVSPPQPSTAPPSVSNNTGSTPQPYGQKTHSGNFLFTMTRSQLNMKMVTAPNVLFDLSRIKVVEDVDMPDINDEELEISPTDVNKMSAKEIAEELKNYGKNISPSAVDLSLNFYRNLLKGLRVKKYSAASTPPNMNNAPVSSWLPNGPSTPVLLPTSQMNAQAFQMQQQQQAIMNQQTMSPSMLPNSPQLLHTATNGYHANMYRPVIKDAAEVTIASELSQFLANIYQQNSQKAAAAAQQYPL